MNFKRDFDLVICGGGLAGAALACALDGSELKVALIEPAELDDERQPSFDARLLALTYSTKVLLERWGLWRDMAPDQIFPIRRIVVQEQGARASAVLSAEDISCEALGWNIAARAIGRCLYRKLDASSNIEVLSPASARAIALERDFALVAVDSKASSKRLRASLAVIADGGRSPLCEQAGFEARISPYPFDALVCQIEMNRPHDGTALELFTSCGPVALLPAQANVRSLVWTHHSGGGMHLAECDPEEFIEQLNGEIAECSDAQATGVASKRIIYPLMQSSLKPSAKERVCAIGNAAHSVHPVAGQGLNLSLRDIATLADVLIRQHRRGWDIGCRSVLSSYERCRKSEAASVSLFTDGLVRLFASESRNLRMIRRLGISAAGAFAPGRRFLLYRTTGLRSLRRFAHLQESAAGAKTSRWAGA